MNSQTCDSVENINTINIDEWRSMMYEPIHSDSDVEVFENCPVKRLLPESGSDHVDTDEPVEKHRKRDNKDGSCASDSDCSYPPQAGGGKPQKKRYSRKDRRSPENIEAAARRGDSPQETSNTPPPSSPGAFQDLNPPPSSPRALQDLSQGPLPPSSPRIDPESSQETPNDFHQTESAFGGYLRSYTLHSPSLPSFATPAQHIQAIRGTIGSLLIRVQSELHSSVRVQMIVRGIFTKGDEQREVPLVSFLDRFYLGSEVEEVIDQWLIKISSSAERYTELGSGFSFVGVAGIDVRFAKFKGDFPIPVGKNGPILNPDIAKKQAVIDLKFQQHSECFRFATLASGHQVLNKNASRIKLNALNNQGLSVKNGSSGTFPTVTFDCFNGKWPIKISDISKWEKENPSVGVVVLFYDALDKRIGTIRVPSNPTAQHSVFLLYGEAEGGESAHFWPIVSMSRLIPRNYHGTRFYCPFCLAPKKSELERLRHLSDCSIHGLQVCEMPTKERSILEFRNFHHKMPAHYRIFADFESLNRRVEIPGHPEIKTKHEPAAYAHTVIRVGKELVKSFAVKGEGCNVEGMRQLLADAKICLDEIYDTNHSMVITDADFEKLQSKICVICETEIDPNAETQGQKKVRDHCHMTSGPNLRGPAHSRCNLSFRQKLQIPVGFHNLSYDIVHVFDGLGKLHLEGLKLDYHVIAKSSEKFLAVSVGWEGLSPRGKTRKYKIQFYDTMAFLPKSLATLIEVQRNEDPKSFKILRQRYSDDLKYDLLCQKGVFPYSYLDSFERFEETCLPPKSAFYNDLRGEHITDEEYAFALKVWEVFECKNIGDYTMVYLNSDVLTLSDVFMTFAESVMQDYKLEVNCYVSTPGLAYDIMLKMCPVKIELITDQDIHLFLERALYGGLVMHNDRYVECGPSDTHPKDPSLNAYGVALDRNNLYGESMRDYKLPIGSYCVLKPSEYPDFKTVEDNGDYGYFVEVSGCIPDKFHEKYASYPFPVSRSKINFDMLSPHNQRRVQEDKVPWTSTEKLVASLEYKKNIVLHHIYLKWCLLHDFHVDQIHKVVRFKQDYVMREYIDHFTKKRSETTSSTKSELCKLFCNSVFGRTVMSVRKHNTCTVASDLPKIRRLVGDCNITSFTIINESMALVFRKKRHVVLNQAISLGISILAISKTIMARFYYDDLLPFYSNPARPLDPPQNVKLYYGDTDSLWVVIFSKDLVKDLTSPHFRKCIDYSNWDREKYGELVAGCKKNQLGFMKSETGSDWFVKLVIAAPKCYIALTGNDQIKFAAKGTPKHLFKKFLSFETFKNSVFTGKVIKTKGMAIRSKKLKLYTMEVVRTAISGISDKVYICDDGISTIPLGHWKIRSDSDSTIIDDVVDLE